MIISKNDINSSCKTVEVLKKGGIIIIPTDTVYGFSGIVDTKTLVEKNSKAFLTDNLIRKIKGREETKPLIQLIAHPEDIYNYTEDKIPTNLLFKWPGPLTIIVHTKKDNPLYADFPTIAFRCPGDKWLREIIDLCEAPIFSTSVNRSGKPVLDEITEIQNEFEKEVSLIIDDGNKKGALPSTIVTIEGGAIKILRQGAVEV